MCLFLSLPVFAQSWRGQELQTVIEALRDAGLPVVYSSGLIKPGMPVLDEPEATSSAGKLGEALRPYGLAVRAGPYGSVLIVRAASPAPTSSGATTPAALLAVVPNVIVTTSRYEMLREPVVPVTTLLNTDVERLPDLGDDPLRAVGRLPGTAINGFSSKTNIRGGATDETLVMFDDLRLFNPFHLKDFQSIFSSIDPAVIEGLDIYTGAFPAPYGDRLSGVIGIKAFEPPGESYRVISLSLFNAAGLMSGGLRDGQGTWLVSARRGNLDILLDLAGQDVGEPRYSDLHGQFAWEFSDEFKLSANALIFDDNIKVHDSDQEESATATYHDSYLWLRADQRPTDQLEGFTLLSYANLRVRRNGTADQPGVSTGVLNDRRSAEIVDVSSQWSLAVTGGHHLDFGGEFRHSSGRYFYADEVTFDLLFDTPGAQTEESRARNISLSPDGEYYAAFLNAHIELPGNWTTELGLRWDESTLVRGSGNLGPRASLLYQWTDATQLRASWGRYWQSQSIDELAVSDGETTFAEAERADQFVFGVEQKLGEGSSLRLEAYTKNYKNPRDRYENLLNTIILLPELKPDRVRVSADKASARGLELTYRSARPGGLDGWGSYSWSEVRDEIDGLKFRRSWDQSHAFSAGVLWSSERWDLSAAATYRTGWPTTQVALEDAGPPGIALAGPRNAERLGNYASLDLRAARRYQTSAGLIAVFLEVSNALNRDNDCCVEYGNDAEDGFEYERQRNLPILPSVGVSWQF
jgi:outer membrane receptor protein involved in Fe transport